MAKQVEVIGMDWEKSERLTVPDEAVEPPPAGLGGGKETPDQWTCRRARWPQRRRREPSQRNKMRIANLAKQMSGQALRTLAHHMDLDWLREAHRLTRKDGAAGIDGQTAAEFERDLESNLQSLLNEAKSGDYRAPAVRRVYIPKGDGKKTRPLGIPTYADKVLQRAVMMLLEPVYEEDFYDFSFGFRPGKSAHDALKELDQGLFRMHGGWVLDVDIQSFFDTLDHAQLRDLFRQRVLDGVVGRLIGKWLRAGVLELEGGVIRRLEQGTPQGGVISPLLANIYLHEVLDTWWAEQVLPRMSGDAFMVRYADDFVMVFSEKQDAERVLEELPTRFGRFGLTLHPEKTRMVRFLPPGDKDESSESFNFLGFTHYLGRTKRGYWTPRRKTAKDRLSRALRRMREWMRANRHMPLKWQAQVLGRKLRGHINYYGLPGNSRGITQFHYWVRRLWKKGLSRRSHRPRLDWEKFNRLLDHYPLPPAVLPRR